MCQRGERSWSRVFRHGAKERFEPWDVCHDLHGGDKNGVGARFSVVSPICFARLIFPGARRLEGGCAHSCVLTFTQEFYSPMSRPQKRRARTLKTATIRAPQASMALVALDTVAVMSMVRRQDVEAAHRRRRYPCRLRCLPPPPTATAFPPSGAAFRDYAAIANSKIVIGVQLEHHRAFEPATLAAILSVPGLCFTQDGPYDHSGSHLVPGETSDPRVMAELKRYREVSFISMYHLRMKEHEHHQRKAETPSTASCPNSNCMPSFLLSQGLQKDRDCRGQARRAANRGSNSTGCCRW